ncbi:MAG: sulfur carrier protein ThiS [Bryobacteraceae bacterium]
MSNTTPQTEQIEIVVNGETRAIPGAMNVLELLEFLGIARDRVAIELDGGIVRKQDWTATAIGPGSKIEIVQFVGGG